MISNYTVKDVHTSEIQIHKTHSRSIYTIQIYFCIYWDRRDAPLIYPCELQHGTLYLQLRSVVKKYAVFAIGLCLNAS